MLDETGLYAPEMLLDGDLPSPLNPQVAASFTPAANMRRRFAANRNRFWKTLPGSISLVAITGANGAEEQRSYSLLVL